jgi:hypothetical protein
VGIGRFAIQPQVTGSRARPRTSIDQPAIIRPPGIPAASAETRPGQTGREVVECVAGDQHQLADQVRPFRGEQLGEGAASVVADQRRVRQAEPLEELAEQPGDTGRRQVRVPPHRPPMPAERQRRDHAPVVGTEVRDDLVPQGSVHEYTVQQHDGRTGARVVVLDRAGGQLDLVHGGPPGSGLSWL